MSPSQPIEFIKDPDQLRECQRFALEILDEFGLVDVTWAQERGFVVAPLPGDALHYTQEQVVRLFETLALDRLWVVPDPERPSYEAWIKFSQREDDFDGLDYPVSISASSEGLDALYSGGLIHAIHHLVIDPQERMVILCTKSDFHLLVAEQGAIEQTFGQSMETIFDQHRRDYLRIWGRVDGDSESPIAENYWPLAAGQEGRSSLANARSGQSVQRFSDEQDTSVVTPISEPERLRKCRDLALSVLHGGVIDVDWAREHGLVVVPVPGASLGGVEWSPLVKIADDLELSRLWAIPSPSLPSYEVWLKRVKNPFAARRFDIPLEFPATGTGFEALKTGPGEYSLSHLIVDPSEQFTFKWNSFTGIHLIAAPLWSIEFAFNQPAKDLFTTVDKASLIRGRFSSDAFDHLSALYFPMLLDNS